MESDRPRRWMVVGVLCALCALMAAERWHTYDEPLERDLTAYAVIGQEMLQGRELYSDLWDHKPPLLYITYAAATALTGGGPLAFYLLGLSAACLTLLGIYAVCSAGGRGAGVGLLGAACWAVVSADQVLQANQPNVEVFVNALVVWSFYFLITLSPDALNRSRVLMAGLLLALASLFKHTAVVFAVAFALAHWAFPQGEYRTARRRAAVQIWWLAGPGFLAWGLVGAYFALQGRFQDFWVAVIEYNRYFAGSLMKNLGNGIQPDFLLSTVLYSLLPLFFLAFLNLGFMSRLRPTHSGALLAGWLLTTWIAVALPGRFFPHYYQHWMPVLCIGAAWALGELGKRLGNAPIFFPAASAGLLLFLGLTQIRYFHQSPEVWSRNKYGEVFIEVRREGERAGKLLNPQQTMFQTGVETGLYYYAGRKPAAGVLWSHFIEPCPGWEDRIRQVLSDLERESPELVVECLGQLAKDHPVIEWIRPRYAEIPDFQRTSWARFLYRKGGMLEARLREQGRLPPAPPKE